MPRSEVVLQVLVASPSDVQAERDALEEAIRRLNIAWSANLGVRLELVSWDTHAYPGFGSDPQAVINAQLPNDFDIFIGIMWTRYGTPTGRAGSGTAEEFDRALARFRTNPATVHLMVYFKDEPVALSSVDLDQVNAVRAFRKRVHSEGGLHWTFTSTEDFQALAELHLTRHIQQWLQTPHPPQSTTPSPDVVKGKQPTTELLPEGEEEEEEGFLDLIEIATERISQIADPALRMAAELNALGGKANERLSEINAAMGTGRQAEMAVRKRIANRVAEDLEQYVARTSVEIPLLAEGLHSGLRALGKAAAMSVDFGPNASEVLRDLRSQSTSLRTSMEGAIEALKGLRSKIAAYPRLTGRLILARKRTLATMDQFFRETSSGVLLLQEMEKSIDDLLSREPFD